MNQQHDQYASGPEVTLVPGTLRGYRVWRCTPFVQEGHLVSAGMDYVWRPNVQERAACLVTPTITWIKASSDGDLLLPWVRPAAIHSSPSPECSCGFYASYDWHKLRRQIAVPMDSYGFVFGVVSAWGRIVLGTGGFRAEYMKVEAIWNPDTYVFDGIHSVSEKYHVPAFLSVEDMLAKFPPSDVCELLKEPE